MNPSNYPTWRKSDNKLVPIVEKPVFKPKWLGQTENMNTEYYHAVYLYNESLKISLPIIGELKEKEVYRLGEDFRLQFQRHITDTNWIICSDVVYNALADQFRRTVAIPIVKEENENQEKVLSNAEISKNTKNYFDNKDVPNTDKDWILVEKELPPENTIVWGFNNKWIDEDFNPEGVRECHYNDGDWNTAKWDNDQDDYYNECTWADNNHPHKGVAPTHWMQLPKPPIQSLQKHNLLVDASNTDKADEKALIQKAIDWCEIGKDCYKEKKDLWEKGYYVAMSKTIKYLQSLQKL